MYFYPRTLELLPPIYPSLAYNRRELSPWPTWSCGAAYAEQSAPEIFQRQCQSRNTNPKMAAIRSRYEIF